MKAISSILLIFFCSTCFCADAEEKPITEKEIKAFVKDHNKLPNYAMKERAVKECKEDWGKKLFKFKIKITSIAEEPPRGIGNIEGKYIQIFGSTMVSKSKKYPIELSILFYSNDEKLLELKAGKSITIEGYLSRIIQFDVADSRARLHFQLLDKPVFEELKDKIK